MQVSSKRGITPVLVSLRASQLAFNRPPSLTTAHGFDLFLHGLSRAEHSTELSIKISELNVEGGEVETSLGPLQALSRHLHSLEVPCACIEDSLRSVLCSLPVRHLVLHLNEDSHTANFGDKDDDDDEEGPVACPHGKLLHSLTFDAAWVSSFHLF